MLRRSALIAAVELRITLRDPLPVAVMVVMPLVLMYFLRPLYGDGSTMAGAEQAVPGLTVLFAFFLVGYVGFGFFRDHGWGTWERLRAGRTGTGEIVLGKALGPLLIYAGQLAVVLGLGSVLFRLPVQGSVAALVLVASALAVCLVAIGIALVSVCATVMQLNAIANLGAILLSAVGGAIVPFHLLPGWMQAVAPASPSYWAMTGMQQAIAPGGGVGDVAAPVVVLLAFTAAAVTVTLLRFKVDERKVSWA